MHGCWLLAGEGSCHGTWFWFTLVYNYNCRLAAAVAARARQLTVSPSFLVPEKAVIQCSEIAAIVVIIVIRHIDSILYSKHYLWVLDGIKRKHKVWFKIPASRQENRTCISVELIEHSINSDCCKFHPCPVSTKSVSRTKQIIVISKKCRK